MDVFDLGAADSMNKEAIIGLARRALGRAGIAVASGAENALTAVAKRSGGSIGNVAARGAVAAGQSARASARAIDTSRLAAQAKATRAAQLKAMTPEARVRALNAAPAPKATPKPQTVANPPASGKKSGIGKKLLGVGALGAGGAMVMGAGSGAQRVLQSDQAPAAAFPPGY